MTHLALYRLLVFNLLEINLRDVLVFHCWSEPEAYPLAGMMSESHIYSQYIQLQQDAGLANIHKDYLDSDITKMGVFLDLGCPQAALLTNQSSRARLYNRRFHWLLFDEMGNLTNLAELFVRANISLDADVTYIEPREGEATDEEEELFVLHDVYSKGSHLGGRLNVTIDQSIQCSRTDCRIRDYLSDLHERTRLQQRMDLTNITFRMAALVSVMPLTSKEEILMRFLSGEEDAHLDSISRLGYRLILHMQDLLHFNLSFTWVGDWSIQDAFGGAIGLLGNESVELCSSPFIPTWNRIHYVHPMVELAEFRAVCIFRTPHNAGIKATVFLEPFMPSVWLAFGALLVLSGCLLWLIFRLEQHGMQRCLDFVPSLLTSCQISFGAACIQGSHLLPKSTGGRLAFIAVMLTSFLMYNYYTSIVVSTLLGSPVRSNIRTVQQLADSSLDVGIDNVPFTKAYLTSSPRPDIRSLYRQKVESKRDQSTVWYGPEEGVLKVRDQPGFVYISEGSFIYHHVEKHYLPREISDLNEIMLRHEGTVYHMIHLNSSYRELITQLEVRLVECGLTSKQRRFFSKTRLQTYSNSFVIQVGMEYAAPLFLSLLGGYSMAVLVLLLEVAWKRTERQSCLLPQEQ
ncbi:ionotropic receptor 75a [Drosophila pseudoobscura]|uniref:Ionotropic receptor 75a n=1 Tax=Drosophila pseudoobscura pseudoobscura TaxID=46245 RepID=A0A6I8W740_DROPS|nr:ionotropic receptor 75a [Drosophila pseudoobscura]XP_033239122.1 ionotropic receptor 75a [Drosophila pseudoobscura]